MPFWRVAFADGHFGRHVGTAVVVADDPEAAKRAVDADLAGETSYGKPYRITTVEPYTEANPHVVYISYDVDVEP